MNTPSNITALVIASGMLLLAHLLRAFRLHVGLGSLRKTWRWTCFAHFIGITLGFLTSAMSYELVVLALCSSRPWQKILSVFYTLMVLRSFDVLALMLFAFAAAQLQDMRILILFLVLIFIVIQITIYGVEPVLLRFERKILQISNPAKGDRMLIHFAYGLRRGLQQLPWRKNGTIAITVTASLISWFLEWYALYLILGEAQYASLTIVDRVGGSLRFLPAGDTSHYDQLMIVVYVTTFVLAAYTTVRSLCSRRK